ncbi:MAG: hypothetical protein M5R42_19790 [Rhodocyclaceae bacterium]|nr:hypothetical protein [Rhodocyclaceae bacterium]
MPSSAIQAGYATHALPVEKCRRRLPPRRAASRSRAEPPAAPAASGADAHPDAAAQQQRPRLLALQEEHHRPPHRAAHGERHRRHGGLCPLSEGASGRDAGAVQGTADQCHQFLSRRGGLRGAAQCDILPQLSAGKPDGYVFRVWVAGCASGEGGLLDRRCCAS